MVESKAAKYLTENFYLHNQVPFLLEGMESAEEDLKLLRKWGFDLDKFEKILQLQESGSSDASLQQVIKPLGSTINLKIDQAKIKKSFSEFDTFKNNLQKYSQELVDLVLQQHPRLEQKLQNEVFKNLVQSLKNYTKEFRNELLVYLQIHANATLIDYTFQNTVLVGIIGSVFKDEDYSTLILTSILDKLFFFQQPVEKIKLFLIRNKLFFNSSLFTKKFLTTTIELLKQNNNTENIRKLILFEHEAIDGSGLLKIKGDNIPLAANLLSIVHHYLVGNHAYIQNLVNIRHNYGVIQIVKTRQQYYPQVFNGFIQAIGGVIEIGRVVKLIKPDATEIYAIVTGAININKPIIKMIMNEHKQVDYSNDLIHLTITPEIKIIPESDEKIIKKVQRIFYKNIIEERYKI